MPSLTALLHTNNDALRLGRCLETTYPCDEILVIDHASTDDTLHVAREFGALVVAVEAETQTADILSISRLISTNWVICLDPKESLSEALAASLFEWKLNNPGERAYAFLLREENESGWIDNPVPQTRLVSANWNRWKGRFPVNQKPCPALEGKLLRFGFP